MGAQVAPWLAGCFQLNGIVPICLQGSPCQTTFVDLCDRYSFSWGCDAPCGVEGSTNSHATLLCARDSCRFLCSFTCVLYTCLISGASTDAGSRYLAACVCSMLWLVRHVRGTCAEASGGFA